MSDLVSPRLLRPLQTRFQIHNFRCAFHLIQLINSLSLSVLLYCPGCYCIFYSSVINVIVQQKLTQEVSIFWDYCPKYQWSKRRWLRWLLHPAALMPPGRPFLFPSGLRDISHAHTQKLPPTPQPPLFIGIN